jgi:hypothetical protein
MDQENYLRGKLVTKTWLDAQGRVCGWGPEGFVYPQPTHCPRGHPYSGRNLVLYVTRRGKTIRNCRACIYGAKARSRGKGQLGGYPALPPSAKGSSGSRRG